MMLRSLKAGGRGAVIPSTALVRGRRAWTDAAFRAALTAAALLVVVLVAWMLVQLVVAALAGAFGRLPLFSGPAYGIGLLAGGVILAIMLLPIISSVSREVIRAVPQSQREAAYALGATRWEMIRRAVLPYGRTGLVGAVILGLGRALGET